MYNLFDEKWVYQMLYNKYFQLLFTSISRLLVEFNSSINPIVYATTVPEFRKIIRKLRGVPIRTESSIKSQKSIKTKTSFNMQMTLNDN